MQFLFHELLYRPLFNLLIFFYDSIPGRDIGIAVILMTLVVRLIMMPLYRQSIRSQRELSVLQPKMKEIQETYKDDREQMLVKISELYKEHQINPFSGIFLILVQIPILLAVYRVSLNIFKPETYPTFYSFISFDGVIDQLSFGFLDVAQSGNLVLAVLVGLSQYYQMKLIMSRTQPKKSASESTDTPDMAMMMNQQMIIIMPVLVGFFAYTLPVAMSLYWITTTLFTIGQEFILIRQINQEHTQQDHESK